MKWPFLGILVATTLLVLAYLVAWRGPTSFQAAYLRGARRAWSEVARHPAEMVTESDLTHLPEAVQRYLRLTGAVGRPRPTHVRATWEGRIRASPDDPWMAFTAEQHDFIAEPSRYFLMAARRGGLPVDVLHVYAGGTASMRVRLLSMIPLVTEDGPELRQAETVTVFNDICLLAPGALVDPAIEWEALDPKSVRARYTSGEYTISAVLVFDEEGWLVDFVSDDRYAETKDRGLQAWQWSTPLSDYRSYGPTRAASRGAGVWHPPTGPFSYIELTLTDLELNGPRP